MSWKITRRHTMQSLLGAASFATLTSCGTKSKGPVKAPPEYKVRLRTTTGDVVILVHRDWSPHGADHFYELTKMGFYNDSRFFRVIPGFIVQFGMNGDPSVNHDWSEIFIQDDPPKVSNKAGTITFARSGPNTRATQVFINLADNSRLDSDGFTPFGEVIEGMENVRHIYSGYGDWPPAGEGPDESDIAASGNGFLDHRFPKLDRLIRATIITS